MSDKISADFIGCTDQPAKEDKFKIKNYIEGLSKFITICQTPITIAVQGDWGSGKTSVMNMVIDKLDPKVFPVTFNAWQFSQFASEEGLTISLITTIIDKIGAGESEAGQNAKSGLSKFGETAKLIGKGIAKAGANFVGDHTIGSSNVAAISDAFGSVKSSMDTIATLKDNFQKCVIEATEKLNKDRILIFIDDLDRLQPIRAVELLEVLKNFLDCERCVFVLAIDYNVVVSGVKSKYGVDITANKGRSFFDKIIQVPFKMPVAQYDISGFVKDTLKDIAKIDCSEYDVENFVALINSSLSSNPRSMKRLFNSFLLLLQVMESELKGDDVQGKKTLFAILCMQQHLEHFYNFIAVSVATANEEIITDNFFNDLASADNPVDFLRDEEYLFQSEESDDEVNEAKQIQLFVKCFNKAISINGSETINKDCMNKIKSLLKASSVTATDTPAPKKAAQKRQSFEYKGQTYMSGSSKMNMGKLAIILIQDYAAETNISAADLTELINSNIASAGVVKKAGLTIICRRDNPALNDELLKNYFHESGVVLIPQDKEMILYRWWPQETIVKLIDILDYGDRVKKL